MNTVGRGTKKIRIRDEAGAFRVLCLAKLADAELATKRYRELLKEQ